MPFSKALSYGMTAPQLFLQWDAAQVSRYIAASTDETIAPAFLNHKLDGQLLPYLTTEHLREMGIEDLGMRLRVKRAILDLIAEHARDPAWADQVCHAAASANNNYIQIEALPLALRLLRESFGQLTPSSPGIDLKRLNESFLKLKLDLTPAIRLIKESKPLPTPTLDPNVQAGSPTSVSSVDADTTSKRDSVASSVAPSETAPRHSATPASRVAAYPPSSPTLALNRFSLGSVLSMGTGKVVQQSVMADAPPRGAKSRGAPRPRLVETRLAGNTVTTALAPGVRPHPQLVSTNAIPGGNAGPYDQPSPTRVAHTAVASTEPLKQLRASSDDSCLKILQQAMKRHHIPRDDWLKYVLVICYGDKERILKLAEKPVIIFKELQELGKHPAIMLRQLATSKEEEEDVLYEDLRIGDDIPGGTL